jgi:hypothetical protein
MRVRAKTMGYYGDLRRREGDIFDLVERTVGDKEKRRRLTAEQQFSNIWMEEVDKDGEPINKTSTPSSQPAPESTRAMDRPVVNETRLPITPHPKAPVKGHSKKK